MRLKSSLMKYSIESNEFESEKSSLGLLSFSRNMEMYVQIVYVLQKTSVNWVVDRILVQISE